MFLSCMSVITSFVQVPSIVVVHVKENGSEVGVDEHVAAVHLHEEEEEEEVEAARDRGDRVEVGFGRGLRFRRSVEN